MLIPYGISACYFNFLKAFHKKLHMPDEQSTSLTAKSSSPGLSEMTFFAWIQFLRFSLPC